MKVLFFLLFFLSVVVLCPRPIHADSNFQTAFDVTYTIHDNGSATAVFSGVITNATDKLYASNYSLQLGFSDLSHVSASDQAGPITPKLTKTDKGTSLFLPFTKRVYGVGKSLPFTVQFDTADIAKQAGNIWEVNIPGITNQTAFKDFTVHVRVPSSFGKPQYIKPLQIGNSLDFDKQSLGQSGISLAFGSVQVYSFSLLYHLKNDYLFPVTTDIALPPSTNYQEIVLKDITPKPINVYKDVNGNWLAKFYLLPSQKITVKAVGDAYVSFTPKHESLSSNERKLFLSDDLYWPTGNSEIIRLAQDLKTPANIYSYVVHHLTYDATRVAGIQERVGAEGVLKNPQSAVCLEFSDLFITLSRAAGIPAREVNGFAYTQNAKQRPLSLVKDILHAWPEYYDTTLQTWIMVDPTWENTTKGTDYFHTLDFDHFAFVIHGTKSTFPVPPGGYKFSQNDSSKDVFVTFGKEEKLSEPQITYSFDLPPTFFAGLPVNGILTFKNISNRLVSPQAVTVTSPSLLPKTQVLLSSAIVPFGFVELPVSFQNTSILTNTKETIIIKVAGNTITKTVAISSLFFQYEALIILFFLVVCLIIAIALLKHIRHKKQI